VLELPVRAALSNQHPTIFVQEIDGFADLVRHAYHLRGTLVRNNPSDGRSAMITGIHAILFSKHAASVRAFLGDALGLASVDAGGGWPIFAGPPLELAVHPTEDEPSHELYLMCDDVYAAIAQLAQRGVTATQVSDEGWGLLTTLRLPEGDETGLYQPRHPSPLHSQT